MIFVYPQLKIIHVYDVYIYICICICICICMLSTAYKDDSYFFKSKETHAVSPPANLG